MKDLNLECFKSLWQKEEVVEIPNNVTSVPLVSICVQTYNQVSFIKECLDSLIFQKTTFPIEILLAEDESDDGTRSICLEYAENFSDKIKLFLHSRQNNIKILGEASANFPGIYNLLNARGKYIAICEGDDKWEDRYKLQKQVDFLMKNPSFSLSYHLFKTIDVNSNNLFSPEQDNQPKNDLNREELIKVRSHPLILTMCFLNVFDRIPLEMNFVLNLDTFIISILGNYGKGKFQTNIAPANYRKQPGGIWSKKGKEKKYHSKINTFENLRKYYAKKNHFEVADFFQKQKKNTIKTLGWFYIKKKQFQKLWFLCFQKK